MNELFGLGLSFTLDGFRELYIGLCILAWSLSLLFAPGYMAHDKHKERFYVFSIITLLATVGVFLSADLFTLFLFFEIMSLASYVWVAQEENEKAIDAAGTYMAVAVIGGLVLLMGILLLYTNIGTVTISEISKGCMDGGKYGRGRIYAAAFCMFFGFSAKAGAFPIHIWLPKAHPVAPAPASALLSGVLTKAGIFGIMIVSFSMLEGDAMWGCFVLGIGLITMIVGALLGIFSVDIKRTLACSSVSQIGFILTGIAVAVLLGEEGSLAKYGTLIHMVNHTLVKMSVFLVAGGIYQNTHSLDLNSIRGFGKNKPVLAISFLLPALSLSGVPGFLGYLSKTGIHEALIEIGVAVNNPGLVKCVEIIFLFAGGCTLCYMTKLFVCVFVENNRDENMQKSYNECTDYMNIIQKACIAIPALMVTALGIMVALKDKYEFFVLHVLKGSFISIIIGIALYFVMVRILLMDKKYLDSWPKHLDLEKYFYKPLIMKILPAVIGFPMRIMDRAVDTLTYVLRKGIYRDLPLPEDRIEGNWITHVIGHFLDYAKSIIRKKDMTYDYEHRLALRDMEVKENVEVAKRSLSFGLILACAGMFLMLGFIIYLVYLK